MTARSRHAIGLALFAALIPIPTLVARAQHPVTSGAPGSAPQPARAAHMQAHFAEALRAHNALIGGDLDGARAAAQRLAGHDEPGLPDTAAPFVAAMKEAAGRSAQASNVAAAGASTARMLATCGECHRALGAMPAIAAPPVSVGGDPVGHMLQHQRATEQLLHGLVVPSATTWNEGAQALRTAPISRSKLPRDPKLTSDLMAEEQRLHQLADRAAGARATEDRIAVYGEMIGACASCHSLHPSIWGPGTGDR